MRWLFVCLAFIALIGCSSGSGYRPMPDGPPLHVPHDLSQLPDPVPRVEAKSKRGNPASYVVHGRTYYVMGSADGYAKTGQASWYGRKFHGRLTSSGEPFDMYQLTAAHRSLPIPTYVRVTNLRNRRSTIVRVNDRGPFHEDRIIDLSYAAAVKLGFHNAGTANVRVEVIDPRPKKSFMLQAGAFSSLAAADEMKAQLASITPVPAFVVRTTTDALFRVRLGPIEGKAAVEQLRQLLVDRRVGSPLVVEH